MRQIKRIMVPNGDDWVEIGVLLQGEDGAIKIKIDRLPASDFDGWVHVCDLVDES